MGNDNDQWIADDDNDIEPGYFDGNDYEPVANAEGIIYLIVHLDILKVSF